MKLRAWDEDFDKELFTEDEIRESNKRAEHITNEMKMEKIIKGLEMIVADDKMWRKADYYATICKYALELLKAQEPKHGQWITDGNHMICSVCENIPFNQVKLNDKMIYNMDIGNMMKYCPICGARMDGDADGTH